MSLHYLLDGYNILKQMPAFRDSPLEDGRKAFLGWIDVSRPQGSSNNPVTVVFDGRQDDVLFPGLSGQGVYMVHGKIKVVFSDGCSADDTIKRMVEKDADRKNCVVVSNDKDVYLYARSLGAKVMNVSTFVGKAETSRERQEENGKYISLSRQDKINKELSRIWLREK